MIKKKSHSLVEDLFALLAGSLFVAFGLFLFQKMSYLIGGTAGLTLILTHVTPFSFGVLFWLVNLPFYVLAYKSMGWRFTLNTFISITAVSLLTDIMPKLVHLEQVNSLFAAVFGGVMIGVGILIMFRHASSLGGITILALFLQNRFGLSAGKVQMGIDVFIVLVGFFLVSWQLLLLSILGALALNMVATMNHKPGRYQIT